MVKIFLTKYSSSFSCLFRFYIEKNNIFRKWKSIIMHTQIKVNANIIPGS